MLGRLGTRRTRYDRIACLRRTLVFIHKHQSSQQLSHLVLDVVGKHAKDNVRTHAIRKPVVNRTHAKIDRLQRTKRPFDRREVLADGLDNVRGYLRGEFEVRRDTTSNLPTEIQKELLGSVRDPSPPGWEEQNREYCQRRSGQGSKDGERKVESGIPVSPP